MKELFLRHGNILNDLNHTPITYKLYNLSEQLTLRIKCKWPKQTRNKPFAGLTKTSQTGNHKPNKQPNVASLYKCQIIQ